MQKAIVILWVASLTMLTGCDHDKKVIHFSPMAQDEFNAPVDTSFIPPGGQGWNAIKKMHDSCMGMSFAANAYFMRTTDTFSLGCIVNRETMKVVKKLTGMDSLNPNLFTLLHIMVSKPCYTKIPDNISVDSIFKNPLTLALPGQLQRSAAELNHLLHTAVYTQAEAGSWTYLELTSAIGKLLDTTNDPGLLQYREALLQPGNMVLIRSGGITNITFHIATSQPLSRQLKELLLQKPVVNADGWIFKPQLFYIDDTHFELNLTGYFQVMGQFMKAGLQ